MIDYEKRLVSIFLSLSIIISVFTFLVPESKSKAYAVTAECTTAGEVYGDVNLDGVADVKDVSYMQKYLVNLNEMSQIQIKIGDVYADSKITINDATMIQLILAKLI